MKGTWLVGATGVLTLVVSVMLMAYSAPVSHAQYASTQSITQPWTTQAAALP
jgi:hypothetical protein